MKLLTLWSMEDVAYMFNNIGSSNGSETSLSHMFVNRNIITFLLYKYFLEFFSNLTLVSIQIGLTMSLIAINLQMPVSLLLRKLHRRLRFRLGIFNDSLINICAALQAQLR